MAWSESELQNVLQRNQSLRKRNEAPEIIPQPVAKAPKKSNSRVLADKFEMIWESLSGPKLESEYKFHEGRKFKVDYCHLKSGVVVEIEGGVFMQKGGHSSVTGILRDIEKYNLLTLRGFKLIRLHNRTIISENLQIIIDFIKASNPYVSYADKLKSET